MNANQIKSIYGVLILADGTVLELDGGTLPNLHCEVVSYGEEELGDEANLFVEFTDGTSDTIDGGLHNVKQFLNQYK